MRAVTGRPFVGKGSKPHSVVDTMQFRHPVAQGKVERSACWLIIDRTDTLHGASHSTQTEVETQFTLGIFCCYITVQVKQQDQESVTRQLS